MADNQEIKHGWYSAKAEAIYGSATFSAPDGGTLVITAWSEEQEPTYLWSDKEYRGLVTSFIADHVTGSDPLSGLSFRI